MLSKDVRLYVGGGEGGINGVSNAERAEEVVVQGPSTVVGFFFFFSNAVFK